MDKYTTRRQKLVNLIDKLHGGNIRECSMQKSIDYSSLYKYYHGQKTIGDGAVRNLIEKFNLTKGYFDGIDYHDETLLSSQLAAVKLFHVKACAGSGKECYLEDSHEPIGLPWKILRQYGLKPNEIFAVEVDGLSMIPTYNPEDYIFVATTDSMKLIKNFEPYLVKYDNELMIKRLEQTSIGITLRCDNPDKLKYPDRPVVKGIDFEILGRIIKKLG